jgi:hypothetical protein
VGEMGRSACCGRPALPMYLPGNQVKREGNALKKIAAALVVGVALLATAVAGATTGRTGAGSQAAATPPIVWGAADDDGKFADDGGNWFYGQLKGAGLTSNRWTLAWDASNPGAIKELAFLERAAPKAQAAGVRILLALYAGTPAPTATQHDTEGFCTWAGKVASIAKTWGIHDFIVWNEPNTRLYWSPQKDDAGNDVASAPYQALLARCYDTIHANDTAANVIGMGLSPRASTQASQEPLVFLRNVGKAYRASGRTKPIMDQLSVHPYPNPNSPTDGPDVGYEVLDRFGIPNMDRIKQAVYDAFNGTGQPTTVNGLTFVIDEVGWQTDTTGYTQYINAENVKTVSEAQQVSHLQTMIRKYFACDPVITSVQLFLLMDEPFRDGKNTAGQTVGGGWQSGLITAGGVGVSKPKQAYSAVAPLFAAGRSACTGGLIDWKPAGQTGGPGSGGSGSGGSGSTAGGSSELGDPTDVLKGGAQLQAGLPSFFLLSAIPIVGPHVGLFVDRQGSRLTRFFVTTGVHAEGDATVTAVIVHGGSVKQALNGAWAATSVRRTAAATAARTVATGSAQIKAGQVPKVKLRALLKRSAKAPAGKYFLAVVIQSKADKTKRYGFAVQLQSVKAKAAKKKK